MKNTISAVWPETVNDPFQQVAKGTDIGANLSTSWHTSTCSTSHQAPKWHLQTEEEKKDQEKSIKAMECKLLRIKDRSYYSQTSTIHKHSGQDDSDSGNDSDNDNDDEENGSMMENREGLPLLWAQQYTEGGLDQALQHQKTDRQYISSYSSWLSCFWCCHPHASTTE